MISKRYLQLLRSLPEEITYSLRIPTLEQAWEALRRDWVNKEYPRDSLLILAKAGLTDLSERTGKDITTLCHELQELHRRKNAGYSGDNPDPWANFRSVARFGIPVSTGVLTRLCDKYARYSVVSMDVSKDQVNESLDDTLQDLIAYSLILICILEE